MASIRARKLKSGEIRYEVQVRVTGQPAVTGTFRRKTDARAWAAQVEADMRDGRYGYARRAKITLLDALEEYINTISVQKADATHAREIRLAKQLLKALGRHTMITEITPRTVAQYRDARMETVSAYTVRLELALLSDLYRRARREWDMRVDNPVDGIARPNVPTGRTVFLTAAESVHLIYAAAVSRNVTLKPYLITLLHSAMRPGEAAGLRAGSVDIENRVVLLEHTKTGKSRMVPVTETAAGELAALVEGKNPNELVFMPEPVRADVRRQKTLYFRESFEFARKRAGFPHLRLHDLRHTAASHLLAAGIDLRTLADIMGHSTMAMVMRYTHIMDEKKRAAVDGLNELGMPEHGRP